MMAIMTQSLSYGSTEVVFEQVLTILDQRINE